MSLINEALKKAQRLRTEGQASDAPPVPGGTPITKRTTPRSANTVVLIGSGAVVLVVISVVVTVYLLNRPKPHAAVEHTEAFLLLRMHVTSWNMAAGLQEQIEDQELSAGLCAALANDDPLATDGVVQDTPHATVSVAVRETPDVVRWSPVRRGSVNAFRQPATGV